MLRTTLIVIHLLELALYTWFFYLLGGGNLLAWLTTVLCFWLLLRALIAALTMAIAQVPLRPAGITIGAFAAEFYAMVRQYSWDAIITAPALQPPRVTGESYLPVLFVHGYMCNSGFWRMHLRRFSKLWPNYLGTINLETLHGSIDDYSTQIDTRIDELLAASGSSQCLIVAHSMGGLAARSYIRNTQAQAKIKGVVTLGTPHTGTLLARFSRAQNSRQMCRFNQWLQILRDSEAADRLPPFEALIGTHDNIVAPQECAAFDLANNTYMIGITHIAMAYNQPVIDWTMTRLKRLNDRPSPGA